MPVIRSTEQLPRQREPGGARQEGDQAGWDRQEWAGPDVFGEQVPMVARRYRGGPGAGGLRVALGGQEALVYVIAGTGSATADGEEFALAPESLLWLAGSGAVAAVAGPDGLDLLVAESTGTQGPPVQPLRKVFPMSGLPHLVSTRDTRDRLDLVTENVPVPAGRIRADRIIYHPGDTAAAHYHTDCHHVFCVLSGSGLLHSGEHVLPLAGGMSALVGPGEEHWFSSDSPDGLSFVEFWAPPPSGTVWTVTGDRCTWAPSA